MRAEGVNHNGDAVACNSHRVISSVNYSREFAAYEDFSVLK